MRADSFRLAKPLVSKCMKGLLSLVLLIGLLIPATVASASSYDFQESDSSIQLSGVAHRVDGGDMVWIGNDKNWKGQIFHQDLVSGKVTQITDTPAKKDEPAVGGGKVVWMEIGEPDDGSVWNIFGHDLATGVTKKLNTAEGNYFKPRVDGDYAVWYDRRNDQVHLYDFPSGTVSSIGVGTFPVVAAGKVVYRDGDQLDLYDIQTKETKSLVSSLEGYYCIGFTFNGTYLLWKETEFFGDASLYRMLDIRKPESPVNLQEPTVKERDYSIMSMGDGQAAWLEEVDGVVQVLGADLAAGKTYQVTHGSTDQDMVAFSGDQLALQNTDGTLSFVTVEAIPDQPVQPMPEAEVKVQVGAEGGTVATAGKEAVLHIPEGALVQPSWITIRMVNSPVEAAGKGAVRLASESWNIESEQPLVKEATLTLAYNPSKIAPDQMNKLGMYRMDDTTDKWIRLGGKRSVGTAEMTMPLKGEYGGVYTVLTRQISFGDIKKHWSRSFVEVLASREIVTGTGTGVFSPDESLTRAQFARMLAGAMGLQPTAGLAPTFDDVSKSHWGYGWIETAAKAGLVKGDGNQFRPDASLTREEMMIMLIKAVDIQNPSQPATKDAAKSLAAFTDSADLHAWGKNFAARAVAMGLVSGEGKRLLPGKTATRAEAAAVIFKFLQKGNQL